jgi:hypothetical protein
MLRRRNRWEVAGVRARPWVILAVLIAVGAFIFVISTRSEEGGEEAAASEPAQVEPIEGTDLNEVRLTADAARRLGIRTAPVAARKGVGTVIPYGAVLYDVDGRTFTYTSPEPLVFVRRPIRVRYIRHGRAAISRGPSTGTEVVIVGAPELFGTEYEVEED